MMTPTAMMIAASVVGPVSPVPAYTLSSLVGIDPAGVIVTLFAAAVVVLATIAVRRRHVTRHATVVALPAAA